MLLGPSTPARPLRLLPCKEPLGCDTQGRRQPKHRATPRHGRPGTEPPVDRWARDVHPPRQLHLIDSRLPERLVKAAQEGLGGGRGKAPS